MEFICRFCHIFQGYSNKNLHFPHIKYCPNSFEINRWRKSVDLAPKSFFFWTSKQLFAIHFLLATCNVCLLVIPEFFAQTRLSFFRPDSTVPRFACNTRNTTADPKYNGVSKSYDVPQPLNGNCSRDCFDYDSNERSEECN